MAFFGGRDARFFLCAQVPSQNRLREAVPDVTTLACDGDKRQLRVSTIRIHNRHKLGVLEDVCLLLQFRALSRSPSPCPSSIWKFARGAGGAEKPPIIESSTL